MPPPPRAIFPSVIPSEAKSSGGTGAITQSHRAEVQQHVADAQRNGESISSKSATLTLHICDTERAHPVVPIGPFVAEMPVLPYRSGMSVLPANRASTTAASSGLPGSSRYPLNIALANSAASSTLISLASAPTNPGYQEAHRYYNEMREYFAKKAYASSANVELVVVKVTFATLAPTKKSPLRISVSRILCSIMLIADQ